MSYDYVLDENGDVDFTKPNIDGVEKAKQQILAMIKTGKGGWNYDKTLGHLFKDYIMDTMPPDYTSFFQSLTKEIEKIEYVKQANITDFQVDEDKNSLILTIEACLTSGEHLTLKTNDLMES